MVNISISSMVGTVMLFLFYVALNPLITQSLGILLPQLGPMEQLVAKSIPLIILVAIALNMLEDDEPGRVVR